MADFQYFVARSLQFYWGDLDNYQEPIVTGDERLFIEIFNRALNDLTWTKLGIEEMRHLESAYQFFTEDNAVFTACCEVRGFARDHIVKLRAFAETIFKANYRPIVKEWKRRGRKPRGWVDLSDKQITTS